jgi:hypothetical protein
MNEPLTTLDYHLWQLFGFCWAAFAVLYCLARNNQALLEARALQLALFAKKRELWQRDHGYPLGDLPLFEKPLTPARRRKVRLIRFKAALARLILPLLGQPIVPPLRTSVQEGRRRP